jgi:hypothetical protein
MVRMMMMMMMMMTTTTTQCTVRCYLTNPVLSLTTATAPTRHTRQRQAHTQQMRAITERFERVIHVCDAEAANRSNNRYSPL